MKVLSWEYDRLTGFAFWFVVANMVLIEAALIFSPKHLGLLEEDSLAENMGACFLFISGTVLVITAIEIFRRGTFSKSKLDTLRVAMFAIASAAFFWATGEEVSWGQRFFDIPTPDFFNTFNHQKELNLHNFNTRFFNNALETIGLLFILLPSILMYRNIKYVLKISIPSFQLILCFIMVSCYSTYTYVKDQDYIAYVALAFWGWVVLRKNDARGVLLTLTTIAIVSFVGVCNVYYLTYFPANGPREVREYLFSFLFMIYTFYMLLDIKSQTNGLK